MDIFLLRHGTAEDKKAGEPDSTRELTREGRRKTADVLKLARNAGVKPALILSSPFIRARQTARIAAEELGYTAEIVSVDSLVPYATPEMVWSSIRDHGGEASILLSSHEPLISQSAAWLLNAPGLRVDIRKSALLCIEADATRPIPGGILRWMGVPKMASAL